ncbi:peptidase M28, partial [Lysinibacillus agricola]
AFMHSKLKKYSNKIVQNNLKKIFNVKHSNITNAPKILVAGHINKVAFMVTSITNNKMLRFQTLNN